MRVLDLFCGLGGWGRAFRDRGHTVIGVDIKDFGQEVVQDIFDFSGSDMGTAFDFIAASPPCEAFSVASIGTHWGGGLRAYEPKTEHARMSIRMVERTLDIIEEISPRAWVIENPRGVLRKLPTLWDFERNTVTFCAYGDSAMKPTDLWGGFPEHWHPRPMCKNGQSCHESAPRGSKTGTQGKKGAAERAVIPYDLSLAMCLAAEKSLTNSPIDQKV